MADDPQTPPPFSTPLYPNAYVWFVLASTLDVFLTFVVLYLGGREVNALANWVLTTLGLTGMILYKYALVAFVILLCQLVGRLRPSAGRRLAEWAVALTFVPVTFTTIMLLTEFLL